MPDDKHIEDIAQAITRYLMEHSDAKDSIDGIINFWLSGQRMEVDQTTTQKALDKLVSTGLLRVQQSAGIRLYMKGA